MDNALGAPSQGSIADRVCRMSEAGWTVRRASRRSCALPFAFSFFTDDRRHGDLLPLLEAFPTARRSNPIAVVFRHDHLPASARTAMARRAMDIVQGKGHAFFVARAAFAGADGAHNASFKGLVSRSIHSLGDAVRRADLGYISPLSPTESHVGARHLGLGRASAIARTAPMPCFALGGINQENWRRLVGLPFAGIAAIGAITD